MGFQTDLRRAILHISDEGEACRVYRMQDLTPVQLVTLAATILLCVNSCFVAISFFISEFRSFIHLTIDFTVTGYFLLSVVIHSVRVFQQGGYI